MAPLSMSSPIIAWLSGEILLILLMAAASMEYMSSWWENDILLEQANDMYPLPPLPLSFSYPHTHSPKQITAFPPNTPTVQHGICSLTFQIQFYLLEQVRFELLHGVYTAYVGSNACITAHARFKIFSQSKQDTFGVLSVSVS